MLELEVKSLKTILDLEGTGGLSILYLGYVEMHLWIPEVKVFDREVLMWVVADRSYFNRDLIALGIVHIDMLIKLATQEELGKLVIVGRGVQYSLQFSCDKHNW